MKKNKRKTSKDDKGPYRNTEEITPNIVINRDEENLENLPSKCVLFGEDTLEAAAEAMKLS